MARLRDAAERRGTSIAAVVREAVEEALDRDADHRALLWERAWEAVGAFSGDGEDVAVNHDEYLDEAYDHRNDDEDAVADEPSAA